MCEVRRGTILPYLVVGQGQEDDICEMLNVGPARGKGPTPLGASPFILAELIRCGLFPSLEEVPDMGLGWGRAYQMGEGTRAQAGG